MRVLLVGFGKTNQEVLRLILRRPWLEVVGIGVRSPARDGEPATKRVPGAPADLRCSTDLPATLARSRPDVTVIATSTRLEDVLPTLTTVARAGSPIVCTAEDLAFIRPKDSAEAAAIFDLAESSGVPIVATGANPGFVLDLWPLTLTGVAWDVERLRARRVVDVSVFGPRVRATLGIDVTPEAFESGIADGAIVGHAGFPESLRVLANAMGRDLERIEVRSEPIVADRRYQLADGSAVEAGRTVGANQQATGWCRAEPWLQLSMTLHVAPAEVGLTPVDRVEIDGAHAIRVTVDPGFGALPSAAAMVVNHLPRATVAPPGVYGPGDLPLVVAWQGAGVPPWAVRGSDDPQAPPGL